MDDGFANWLRCSRHHADEAVLFASVVLLLTRCVPPEHTSFPSERYGEKFSDSIVLPFSCGGTAVEEEEVMAISAFVELRKAGATLAWGDNKDNWERLGPVQRGDGTSEPWR